ncbi:M35 family metallo-endopeptidase [Pendulispora brunnea]|uniref:M35 family metallo-endopeptidase n=1 Tax=Pendulispora brunnea TaxID=2905690 RepID=A0ABZ2KND6_9BACT
MNTNFGRRLGRVIALAALPIVVVLAGCSGASEEEGAAPAGEEAQTGPVRATLSADKLSVGGKEGVNVKVTLTNESAETVRLLKWETIADGLKEPLFVLTHDGQPVKYQGAHYKRAEPTESDYLTLGPGEALTGSVDLAQYYDMSASGNYDVQFRRDDIVSNHVTLQAESHISPQSARAALRGAELSTQAVDLAAGTKFVSCSSSRQSGINTAYSSAQTYATNASNYVNDHTSATLRYTTWFGSYTSARHSTVQSHFSKIKNAYSSQTFTFDCTCTDSNTYAYVYPDQSYYIYLCGAFWSAPNTGTDSRAGTIIHESSHFTVLGGTDDYVYGQSGAKNLAKSNPGQAVMNADSHEYFAENNPAQP